MRHGKACNLLLGAGIARPATCDDQRLLGRLEQLHGFRDAPAVRTRPGNLMHRAGEELGRVVTGHFLHILRQADEGRAAVGGVKHHRHGLRQRRDDLLGMDDAVPVARHRLVGIIDADRRIAEVLDLLHHRVRPAVDEHIARQEQHGQAVGVGHARCRYHVGGAGADGRGRHHDLPPPPCLGKADRRQPHGLLVLPAPCREHVLHLFQRLREAGDVAMPEDREDAGKQRHFLAVHDGELVDEIAHQRLRHGEADCGHAYPPVQNSVLKTLAR